MKLGRETTYRLLETGVILIINLSALKSRKQLYCISTLGRRGRIDN